MATETDAHEAHEAKDGTVWYFGALCAAVLLTLALWRWDDALSNSTREQDLGRTLRELRGAQTSLPSNVTDLRQTISLQAHGAEAQTDAHGDHGHH